MHYDFHKDLKDGHDGQLAVIDLMSGVFPDFKYHDDNHTYSHDFSAYFYGADRIVEVKTDIMSRTTGNVAIEYECRGKPSDIAVSLADLWVFKYFHRWENAHHYCLVWLRKLKEERFNRQWKHVTGGDEGSNTRMYLVPATTFDTWGLHFVR